MRRFLIVAAAVVCIAMLATVPAYGASAAISVSPSAAPAGSTVHISGSIPVKKCPASDGATITSDSALFPPDGFGPTATRDSQGAFAVDYTVPTSTPPGSYTLGLRCGGGNVGVSATLTVTPAGGPATGVGGAAHDSARAWTAIGATCLLLATFLFVVRRRVARRES